MRYYSILTFSLLMVACSTVKVNYDYDRDVDFTAFTTYNYFSDLDSGLGALDERRLLDLLDSTLGSRGYRLAEGPDFLINILGSQYRTGPGNSVGVGLGSGGRNLGGGICVGIPVGGPGLKRSIQFDFVDAQRDALFWQAQADSGYRENLSPAAREEQLRAVVDKVFSKYPPEDQ